MKNLKNYSLMDLGLVALFGALILAQPVRSHAQALAPQQGAQYNHASLASYDNFNSPQINPAKWFGVEIGAGAGAPNDEAAREIAGGRLRLSLTTHGAVGSDSGVTAGSQRLRLHDPAPIKAFQAKVILSQALAQGNAANPAHTEVAALITGHFFNDGSSSQPGDETGDVIAHIGKRRDNVQGDSIEAFVGRCSDPKCLSFTAIATHTFKAKWTPGRTDTLGFAWEPENDRFVFAVNPGSAREESVALSYSAPDTNAPGSDRKELRVENNVANSTAGQKQASVRAYFDDIMLNPEAIP